MQSIQLSDLSIQRLNKSISVHHFNKCSQENFLTTDDLENILK